MFSWFLLASSSSAGGRVGSATASTLTVIFVVVSILWAIGIRCGGIEGSQVTHGSNWSNAIESYIYIYIKGCFCPSRMRVVGTYIYLPDFDFNRV